MCLETGLDPKFKTTSQLGYLAYKLFVKIEKKYYGPYYTAGVGPYQIGEIYSANLEKSDWAWDHAAPRGFHAFDSLFACREYRSALINIGVSAELVIFSVYLFGDITLGYQRVPSSISFRPSVQLNLLPCLVAPAMQPVAEVIEPQITPA